jgi:epoxyqueuosine reductase
LIWLLKVKKVKKALHRQTPEQNDLSETTELIRSQALALGFSAVGFTDARPLAEAGAILDQWLDRSLHGTMTWMSRTRVERRDPRAFFPEARSVVVVALNYYQIPTSSAIAESSKDSPPEEDHARIARYALGRDYHKVLKKKLRHLSDFIKTLHPDALTRPCVDSFPLLEKPLAQRAGLGWIGKHTNLIMKRRGSFFFLGELLTSLPLISDTPFMSDHCGTCTACQDACPTNALSTPYELDASRCISYLTIEHTGDIEPELLKSLQRWIFGCDICQEVCPWNRFSTTHTEPDFNSRIPPEMYEIRRLLNLSREDFDRVFAGTPIKRAGYERFMTSIKAAEALVSEYRHPRK